MIEDDRKSNSIDTDKNHPCSIKCIPVRQVVIMKSMNPITTSFGDIEIDLYSDVAPRTVENLKLARSGFYDTSLFHRIVPGFVIQGGDPVKRCF